MKQRGQSYPGMRLWITRVYLFAFGKRIWNKGEKEGGRHGIWGVIWGVIWGGIWGYTPVNTNWRGKAMVTQIKNKNRKLAHKRSVTEPPSEIAQYLRENLGVSLISILADVDSRTVARWLTGDVAPRAEAEKRLRLTYQIFHLLAEQEAPSTARAWFMGMNEQLDDLSPIEAIAVGRSRDALIAARSFIAYG